MTESESQKEDAVDRAANWDTVLYDDNYYTALEVSTYYAATSIIEASQNSHVIWVDYPYHEGNYKEYTDSFKSWMADQKYVTRYDSTKLDNVFDAVKDQLIYLLDAGSTVVDYMGYVEGDYNLDFINKAEALTLTVGGDKKDVVDLGDNTYGFGEKLDNGEYEHELTYYPANDGEEHFVWTIHVPVTKDKPVKLTYKVKLVNPKSAPGTYGVYDKYGENNDGSATYSLYTNNKATLTPVDSNGKKGDPEDFRKPTVSYTVPGTPGTPEEPTTPSNPETPGTEVETKVNTTNVAVGKVWQDNENQDGIRPESVTVQLYCNGTAYGSPVVLNRENSWWYRWDNLDAAAAWTVDEVNVADGYTKSITKNAVNAWVIVNTHTPGTQAVDTSADTPDAAVTPQNPTGRGAGTGDESTMLLWFALMLVSGTAVAGAVVYRRRRHM